MSSTLRKFIWFTPIIAAFGIAVAFAVLDRSSVALEVISVQSQSGSPVARCEIQNRGDRSIELSIHSIDQTPFYYRLERSGRSWRRVLWDTECGIDLEHKLLAPGQVFPFTAHIIDSTQPTRLALNYRLDGVDYTVSTKTIVP